MFIYDNFFRHVHNEYGLWHIKGTYQGLLDRTQGKYRPFILTRAAFAGTQRYVNTLIKNKNI